MRAGVHTSKQKEEQKSFFFAKKYNFEPLTGNALLSER
jgi:hypothetical protein